MRLGRLLPMLLVLAPLVVPASASANDFQRVFRDYKDNGRLDGCYRAGELHNASRQIPPDIEQYAPGFGDALAGPQNGCGGGGGGSEEASEEASTAPAVSAGSSGPGAAAAAKRKVVKEPPAPKPAADPVLAALPQPALGSVSAASGGMPGALIALLVAGGLALLLALAWAVAWFMGWSPERLTRPLSAAFGGFWERLSPGR